MAPSAHGQRERAGRTRERSEREACGSKPRTHTRSTSRDPRRDARDKTASSHGAHEPESIANPICVIRKAIKYRLICTRA